MVNNTPATINITPTVTETIIDLYNGGRAPQEIAAFLFFIIICVGIAIWFIWMIFEKESQ